MDLLKDSPPDDPQAFTGNLATGGLLADYSGASPVASALDPRKERDLPTDPFETNTYPFPVSSKPDISTLLGIGHFYFALTGNIRPIDLFTA
jgi:hypothetical protein